MNTNIELNSELLAKAKKISGLRTKKDVVNHALAEFVQREEQRKITGLFGTVEYDPDYDYKRERQRK
ncbi:MAG: type II toxin-antitoxin system VapB family antitoxin [Verrucomicrobia subdivision 3 bacterium]|nr:type II toxin-antitoxin system VapB family antitoxin [Limisphaerales bacterium]